MFGILAFCVAAFAQFLPEELAERAKWEEFLKTAEIVASEQMTSRRRDESLDPDPQAGRHHEKGPLERHLGTARKDISTAGSTKSPAMKWTR